MVYRHSTGRPGSLLGQPSTDLVNPGSVVRGDFGPFARNGNNLTLACGASAVRKLSYLSDDTFLLVALMLKRRWSRSMFPSVLFNFENHSHKACKYKANNTAEETGKDK